LRKINLLKQNAVKPTRVLFYNAFYKKTACFVQLHKTGGFHFFAWRPRFCQHFFAAPLAQSPQFKRAYLKAENLKGAS